jgi:hypothetical protein
MELVQNIFQMFYMFFCHLGIHQDIINMDDHKLVQFFMENGIHKGCEHQGSLKQHEWHHQELTWTIHGPHYCLFHILICDSNVIIPQFEINSTKIFFPIELIQHVINVRQMIVLMCHYFIQGTTINTHPQLVVFFIHKQDRCPIGWLVKLR